MANFNVIDDVIVIPEEITKLEDGAFEECTPFKTITIPNNINEIEQGALSFCSSLESITLPESVTEMGDNIFFECTSLKSINIPERVTEIGEYLFEACPALKTIYVTKGRGKEVKTMLPEKLREFVGEVSGLKNNGTKFKGIFSKLFGS